MNSECILDFCFCVKGQGWRVVEDYKEWKKQEDEERGDGMCSECGG